MDRTTIIIASVIMILIVVGVYMYSTAAAAAAAVAAAAVKAHAAAVAAYTSCIKMADCPTGYVCAYNDVQSKMTCVPTQQLIGGPCISDIDCESNASCISGTCAAATAIGQLCTTGSKECGSGYSCQNFDSTDTPYYGCWPVSPATCNDDATCNYPTYGKGKGCDYNSHTCAVLPFCSENVDCPGATPNCVGAVPGKQYGTCMNHT